MAVVNNMALEVELKSSAPKVEAPSPEPKVEPADETKVDPAVEPEKPEMFKLPDGREVDAAGLKQEYENLLPEFTRKSQRLAELEGNKDPNINNLPDWKKDGYVPKSYAEIVELGKQEALAEITRRNEAEVKARAEISKQVEDTVTAIKAKDPKLDENALFAHAHKYGFRDLKMAYENMSEMKRVATVTEERVLAGTKKKVDPIATGAGAGSGSAPRYPNAGSATEFLARLKTK